MFVDPKRSVDQLGITPGMKIADLGAGAGFYALELAKAVGPKGRVYAIDIQQELLSRIKKQAHSQHMSNLEVIWGDIESESGTRLQENSIDIALISNTLFQIARKEELVKELRRIIKKTGKLVVIDWSDSFGGIGPAAEDVVSEKAARTMFEQAGFTYERAVSAGDHHYGLIFKR